MDISRDTCTFIPPRLLERIGAADALALDEQLRVRRSARAAGARTTAARAVDVPAWTVHDADNATTLPGRPVRAAGQPATGDVTVDEAADGIEATLAMFAEAFARDSYDGAGAPVSITVHYGKDYDNAFWDGTQLVFGDGDGTVFERFTGSADVLAHEFGHAVTEHTAALVYRDQPGALNESVSDVFAACFKQHRPARPRPRATG
ncbi:M4 family metallopeptidase [Nocardioides sp. B-3]|uniref:M4 family metallopeptidase n=1 Tax=Nocardioides sp. B-3 TaxID=2895565 RepID=UPI0021538BE4|nr:M4 family metallopeptidase [Nocardioides sp. B-3]